MLSLFSSKGRIDRLHYLFLTVFAWTVFIVPFMMFGMPDYREPIDSWMLFAERLPVFVPAVAVLWLTITSTARRAHDCGWSGWLAVTMVVPVLSWVVLLVLLVVPGTRGRNSYGDQPVEREPIVVS